MTDHLLATAVANWEPRFTANGVDASDYARITAPLTSWAAWCGAWHEAGEEYLALADEATAHGYERSAGEHLARAALYFHFGKFLFFDDPDQAVRTHIAAVGALQRATPLLGPRSRWVEIPYRDRTMPGVLRTPDTEGPHPTVILVAGLDSTKEEFRAVEQAFLDRGLATLAFDGPGQGQSEEHFPIQAEWGDVGDALCDFLIAQPDVDEARLGVWGVSMGGFYATRMAAAGLPVRAFVSLSGFFDFADAWDHLNPLTQRAFQVRSGATSLDDAKQRAKELTMVGLASRITAPLLVIAGKRDRLFSWHDAERLVAETSGPSTLLLLDEGNHGCANVITRHRARAADWLSQQLQNESVAGATK